MDDITNNRFLTINHQKILLLLYDKKKITFKDQFFYNNQMWFRKEMRKLINSNVIKKINDINGDMRKSQEYFLLTIRGKIFVEEFLRDFIEKNR